ncbi:MAG: SDR family oxidoreductase [Steroidobacteraceae bacterium]
MILLTGATGKTAGAAAKILAAQKKSVRALVRNESKATALRDAGIEVVTGDLEDAAAVRRALDGIEHALLVVPNREGQLALEQGFVTAAAGAGVRHIVKLSSMEAGADARAEIPRLHHASEEHIRRSGLAWTMLRPNFFMQNLLGSAGTIRDQGKIFLPLGNGRVGMSDARDVGAVAAHVLTSPGHENRSYDLTGPEVLSFYDVAERFTQALGKPIEYVNVPLEGYREVLRKHIPSQWHADAVCELFAEIARDGEGSLSATTSAFRDLMGREPTSLKSWIEAHRAAFGG